MRTSVYKTSLSAVCIASIPIAMLFAAPRNFVPDFVLGSSVAGLRTIGEASWQAAGGELTATPRNGSGGWLVLDRGYQDVEFYTEFHCAAQCDAGVLLRSEKTGDGGLHGVYV